MSAGKNAPHRAHTGRSIKGTSHGRPVVVPNTSGMDRVGSPATLIPCEILAERAIKAAVTTPMVGAKLEMVFRAVFVK